MITRAWWGLSMKKVPPDLMDRLAGKKNTERTREEHEEHTESTREERDFTKYRDSKFDTLTVRLLPEDIQRLKLYYEKRGIPVSQGLRSLILDFMERQGI